MIFLSFLFLAVLVLFYSIFSFSFIFGRLFFFKFILVYFFILFLFLIVFDFFFKFILLNFVAIFLKKVLNTDLEILLVWDEIMKEIYRKLIQYIIGLFVMTVGIAFSIKTNMGISPVSTIPYTMTVIWGVEIGLATIIFHCGLVLLQFILLRSRFGWNNLAQVPVGVLFGYFTSFSVYLLSFIPESTSIWISIVYMIISIFTIAFGIFLYLPPNLVPLAGEGAMQAVSIVFDKKFSNVKIGFDIAMVLISACTCLFFIHSFGSVGICTIISAVFVGMALKAIAKTYTALTGKTVDLKQA